MSQAVTAVTSLKYLLRFPTAISHRYLQTISLTSLHTHFHHQIFHLSILFNYITIHHTLIICKATLLLLHHLHLILPLPLQLPASTLVLMFCCADCGVEPGGMCELCVEFMITSTWGYLFQLNVTKCQNSLKYYSYLNNEENLNTLYISPVAVSV